MLQSVWVRNLLGVACMFLVALTSNASPVDDIQGVDPGNTSSDQQDDISLECEYSKTEAVITELLMHDPRQQRSELECDPDLMRFARERARDMAENGYVGHVNSAGTSPNEMLRSRGYDLPKYYVGGRSNTIESILGGEARPRRVWEMLMDSAPHRSHLAGEGDVYRAQRRFGVAHVNHPRSAHRDYWVIVIVEPSDDNQPPMTCSPPPSICIAH